MHIRSRSRRLAHCAALSSSIAVLAACGGSDDAALKNAAPLGHSAVSAGGAAAMHKTTWVPCAAEWQACVLPSVGNFIVRYGVDATSAQFVTRSFTGVASVACSNDVFGDPAFGVVKQCFYAVEVPDPTPTWTPCALESQVCAMPSRGDYEVLYGVDATGGRSVALAFTDVSQVACRNDVFGDPAFGVVKQCFYRIAGTAPPPPPPPPGGWVFCANEWDVCTLPGGNVVVLYGPDTSSSAVVTQNYAGVVSIPCRNDVFGDPAVGIVKRCFYRAATPPPPTLVSPPITLPPLRADGTVLWGVPVDASPLALDVRPFATLPLSSFGTPPRLNVLAHWNNRLFVGDELDGRIYEITDGRTTLWFDAGAAVLASTGRALSAGLGNAHAGLRGLAFHPDFAVNGKFYVTLMEQRPASVDGHHYLSDVVDPINADSVLVEWSANPSTMVPSPTSYREVFRVGIPVYDHPIKQITFRPGARAVDADHGLLYVAHGDGSVLSVTVGGGMANDARGKILRIDPLARGTARYTVPAANPFVGSTMMIPEVYSLGHRNPHHLAFANDGTLIVAEAGRDNIDEVNVIQPGANYGWPAREGTLVHTALGTLWDGVQPLPVGDESVGYTYPAMQFLHQGVRGAGFTGQSIGGGYVVENGTALSGHYFATDFVFSGDVFVTPLASLKAAVTRGPAASLRMAPIDVAAVRFDHDNDPATPPLQLLNLRQMTQLAPNYDGSGRVDIRYGQGPRGELYLLSKRDRRVYLVTNSVP